MGGLDAQTVIAVCAFLAILLSGFNALLNAKIDPLKKELDGQKTDINSLKTGQAELNKRMDGIENKLDQLLSKKP